MNEIQFLCANIEQLKYFTKITCNIFKPNNLILLEGFIGTGKTQLVKFYCENMDYKQNVTSPSYTLINMYPIANYNIVHVDFYRIELEKELLEIGIDDYLINNITFIEWGEKFQDFFNDYLKIKLEHTEDVKCESCRKITLSYKGSNWELKFQNIKKILENNKIRLI